MQKPSCLASLRNLGTWQGILSPCGNHELDRLWLSRHHSSNPEVFPGKYALPGSCEHWDFGDLQLNLNQINQL